MADRVAADMTGIVRELKLCSKQYASSVRKQIRAAVTEAGAELVAKVRSEALAQGLHRAAAATTARANFSQKSAGVRIVTSRGKAPYAPLYELGNKDDGGSGSGTFTNGTGGVIRKRPFFFPSIEKADAATEQKFLDAIDEAVREAGFR